MLLLIIIHPSISIMQRSEKIGEMLQVVEMPTSPWAVTKKKNRIIAVCFDGASTMSGKTSGIQARCKAYTYFFNLKIYKNKIDIPEVVKRKVLRKINNNEES